MSDKIYFSKISKPEEWPDDVKVYNFRFKWAVNLAIWILRKLGAKVYTGTKPGSQNE